MRQLLDLISTHSNVNSIMPVITLISIAAVLFIYVLIKPKSVKYVVTLIIIAVGAIMMFTGYENMLDESGLALIITASKVLLFGIVGLLFSCILDILDSLFRMFSKPIKKSRENKEINKKNLVKSEKEIKNGETRILKKPTNVTVSRETKYIKKDETKKSNTINSETRKISKPKK